MPHELPDAANRIEPASDAAGGNIAWHQSLRARAIVAALLVAAWIAGGIFLIMQWQGRSYLDAQSHLLIEQSGNTVVSALTTRLQEITALNRSLAATSSVLPKSDDVFLRDLPSVIDFGGDPGVAGGGFWPEPYMFSPDRERRAFFWGRGANNLLEYTNGPNEADSPYYNEEWYVPSKYEAGNRCYWSASYIDPHTFEPMVTCTTPIRQGEKLIGVTSLDMRLDGLAKLTAEWSKRTGGYIFLVDRNNRFIAFGDNAMTKRVNVDAQGARSEEFLFASDLASAQPAFAEAGAALSAMDRDLVAAARKQDAARVDTVAANIQRDMVGGRDSIDAPRAELAAAALVNPYRDTYSLSSTTLVRRAPLADDPVLQQPSELFLFHVPETYWKLGIVKPVAEIVAVASAITNYLILYLLATVLAGLAIAYLLFNRWLLKPIQSISDAVRKMSAAIVERRHHELGQLRIKQLGRTEIGMLGRNVNAFANEIALSEGKLAQANTQLERRVRERTQELSNTLAQLKNSQTQLVQSEKMASLGQMVAGIAHEINTPLGYVKNNVLLGKEMLNRYFELSDCVERFGEQHRRTGAANRDPLLADAIDCIDRLKDDRVAEDSLQLVSDALYGVDQISDLVNDLRNFSRLDEAKVKDVNVHECIDSALNIARNQLKAKVEVVKDFGDLPTIACSPSQINQVFINLLNNAAQAMDDRGRIVIQTRHADGFVHVAVNDNGRGIPKDVIGRIFEPFFTTKPIGQGTGLGLSITYQIVQQHGGHIRVESEIGRGTRFVVSLPTQAFKAAA